MAVVPGDEVQAADEEWEDMEHKIRSKYMPNKLATLSGGVAGAASDPSGAAQRRAAAATVSEFANSKVNNAVFACATCEGQGKVCLLSLALSP